MMIYLAVLIELRLVTDRHRHNGNGMRPNVMVAPREELNISIVSQYCVKITME